MVPIVIFPDHNGDQNKISGTIIVSDIHLAEIIMVNQSLTILAPP